MAERGTRVQTIVCHACWAFVVLLGAESGCAQADSARLAEFRSEYSITSLRMNERGTPESIQGDLSVCLGDSSPVDVLIGFLERNKDIFGMTDPRTELQVVKKGELARGGMLSLLFEQRFKGIPVRSGEIRADFNRDNDLYLVCGRFHANIDLPTEPIIPIEDLCSIVGDHIGADEPIDLVPPAAPMPPPFQGPLRPGELKPNSFPDMSHIVMHSGVFKRTLLVLPSQGRYRFAWQVQLDYIRDLSKSGDYFIDAISGDVLRFVSSYHPHFPPGDRAP